MMDNSFGNASWHSAVNTTTARASSGLKPLVTDEMYKKQLITWPVLWFIILPPGLVANAINIRTFLRMGLDDSVTISFFVLAISDIAHLLIPLGNIVAVLFLYLDLNYGMFFIVQPMAVYIYILNIAIVFNNWSGLITTYLALQRCLCIVMPFHFKTMFTKVRTWCVMVFLGIFSIFPGIGPLFTYAIRRTLLENNKTQYVFYVTPIHSFVQKYIIDTIAFSIINTVSMTICCSALLAMSYSLAASVKFRKRTTVTKAKNGSQGVDGNSDAEEKHGSKERVAIIQVAILTTIYVVSNLPKLAVAMASAVEPEYGLEGTYKNIILVLFNLRMTFDYLNSAVNFLVYYKYNTRYRKFCFKHSMA